MTNDPTKKEEPEMLSNEGMLRLIAEWRASLGRRERTALRRFYIAYRSHPDRTGSGAIEAAEAQWEDESPACREIKFLRDVLSKIATCDLSASEIKRIAAEAVEVGKGL